MPIAIAIALTTNQSAWRIWKTDFASSVPSYLLGAAAAAVVIQVTESSGYWLTLLLTAAPLYLTYKMYRAGKESEARQGAILEAAHDAIITMDQQLNIREFNPAAEQMFGYARLDILGRNVGAAAAAVRPRGARRRTEGVPGHRQAGRSPAVRSNCAGSRPTASDFPVELTVVARRVGQPRRAHRVRPRHHRAPRARGTAAAVAEARSHRTPGRRRRPRLQQHPHEHHGRRRSDAHGSCPRTIRSAAKPPRSSSRSCAARA